MRANSLRVRLFLSAAFLTVVILIATGAYLSAQYRAAVERSFDRRLNVYLGTLINDLMSPEDGNDDKMQIRSLSEQLFELPLSGWYWQVERTDESSPKRRASRSLWDREFPYLAAGTPLNDGGLRQGYAIGPEDQRLRVLERPIDLGDDGRYVVAVAGDATEIAEETRAFNLSLAGTFGALTFVLLISTLFQVGFGLAPLKKISESLALIRSGKAERLEGDFPVEIAPLARETNELLEANREIVERARTHVGNLAHALKTPLSVIVNEANVNSGDFASKVTEQAAIMRDQVTRHLERARLAARLTVVGTETDVTPVIEALCRTMEKIHRHISVEPQIAADLKFQGEQQDLEEMVGNLVDNACKWAQAHVSIEVRPEAGAARSMLRITVDDDGRGLSAEEREQVAHRGRRLDETKPGSGLGLSIVVDLAQLYRGSLVLGAAPSGGLRAELVLPAA